jgi:hypothetical protein
MLRAATCLEVVDHLEGSGIDYVDFSDRTFGDLCSSGRAPAIHRKQIDLDFDPTPASNFVGDGGQRERVRERLAARVPLLCISARPR